MQAILKTLPELLERIDEPEMRQAVAIAIWPSAVGEQLKEHSRPFELNDRVLSVAVPDIRWKREFEHHAAQIVYKLNAAAGRSIIGRIECVVDANAFKNSREEAQELPEKTSSSAIDPKILQAAANISDTELRNNFVAAAANCMNRTLTK